jgi:glycosyltransferase involved in cell wall biosynthesis
LLEDWAYRLAHRVITHSQNAQAELMQERKLPAAKLDLILHGNYLGDIPVHVTRSVARAHFGFSAEQRVLLFFGQIKEVKGLDVLLNAFALARAKDERLHLVIAGRPWKCEFAPFQALIDRHGLDPHCSLHIRYIPDGEVALFYRSADLVVLPYRRIYQSGVVLQAMSHGAPVMVSDIAGLLEAVEDDCTGFVFKSQDPQSLADRIGDVFAVPGRAADVGAAGLRRVTEHNDWCLLGAQTLACYQRAIGPEQ